MEELKRILCEMNYIYAIYDDIRNLYHSLEFKDDIYKKYNINDLILLDKISIICNHIMFYDMSYYDDNEKIFKMKGELYYNEIIKKYKSLEYISKETNSLNISLRYKNDFFIYDNKDYIKIVKSNLNYIINKYNL